MVKRIKVVFLVPIVLLFLVSSLDATTARLLSLGDKVALAERIFVGTVTEVREGKDEHGTAVTYVTFALSRSLKGQVPDKLTIKQLGRRLPGKDKSILNIPGLPMYSEGEEVVLFLHGTSAGGFTSPVGLGQGKFKVIRQKSKAFVVNELAKGKVAPRLLYGVEPDPGKPGLEMERFLSTVKKMVRSPR